MNRRCLKVLNDTKLVLNEHECPHLGSIWYHSEPSDISYSKKQFLALDFFAASYSKTALVQSQYLTYKYIMFLKGINFKNLYMKKYRLCNTEQTLKYVDRQSNIMIFFLTFHLHIYLSQWPFNPHYKYHYEGMVLHDFFHHPDILPCITFHLKLLSSFRVSSKVYRDILNISMLWLNV